MRELRILKVAAACLDNALSTLPGHASSFAGLAYTYHPEVDCVLAMPWWVWRPPDS